MNSTITDVAGLEAGHYTDRDNATGCTVIICRQGAVGGQAFPRLQTAGLQVGGQGIGNSLIDGTTRGDGLRFPYCHAYIIHN